MGMRPIHQTSIKIRSKAKILSFINPSNNNNNCNSNSNIMASQVERNKGLVSMEVCIILTKSRSLAPYRTYSMIAYKLLLAQVLMVIKHSQISCTIIKILCSTKLTN